ncbi:5'/3'-nucleotidase SurE [Rhodocaloribacter litoris]|uniref:5'/3'-nucleotidase SurE n=1 Tax=Rhodocaloribacter litoris TaxID=2558931 RepID=UPI001423DD25|nr:5'/3'-nucleotidase SurE [Rhodocaloribacter litoris]QXD16297.1 5'/3'-nucleotidase SurE [Rhodocaloribacter litoris]
MKRPLILISNDDGIDAPGLRALAWALAGLGTLYVVAPLTEQSAVGHAITVRDPVRVRPWPFDGPPDVAAAYAVGGTPADCVKLAIDKLVPRRPDLVVSGINQGPNTAVNVIYSGTVSAATEASILGIDALAVSLCRWEGGDFEPAGRYARRIAEAVLRRGLPPGLLLNVNVPALSFDEIKGIRTTRQARSRWEESFIDRVDPANRPYYWLTGRFVNLDDGENTDLGAVEEGYVSVTPLQHDLTAHTFLEELARWTWDEAPAGEKSRAE